MAQNHEKKLAVRYVCPETRSVRSKSCGIGINTPLWIYIMVIYDGTKNL